MEIHTKHPKIFFFIALLFIIPQALFAQSSTNYEIASYVICAGGEAVESTTYNSPRNTIGDSIGNISEGLTVELSPGYIPQAETIAPIIDEEGSIDIEVTGAIDDNDATVEVNGIEALVNNDSFSATITLFEGVNFITVSATDLLSNTSQKQITVYLDTKPPTRPTVNPVSSPTALATQILSGTKEANASIWINGAEAVPMDSSNSWSHEVSLDPGDNSFNILSKDRAGNESTSVTIGINFNAQASVITIDSPADGTRTNYSLITVIGTVEDPNSGVWVNGIKASLAGTTFTAEEVSLARPGSNIITAQATNSLGQVSTARIIVILGSFPSIVSFVPQDGAKFYEGEVIELEAQAVDLDGGFVEYQFMLDGSVKQSWSSVSTYNWNTSQGDTGEHTLTVETRDNYGGKTTLDAEVYIYVEPIAFPIQ